MRAGLLSRPAIEGFLVQSHSANTITNHPRNPHSPHPTSAENATFTAAPPVSLH